MSNILTSLFQWLQTFIGTINPIPFFIVNPEEKAIIIRLGKYNRTVDNGLKWKIPFIEKERKVKISYEILYTSVNFITKDDISCEMEFMSKYKVNDPRKALLEYTDYSGVIDEIIRSEFFTISHNIFFKDVNGEKIIKMLNDLRIIMNEKKMGFYFDTLCKTRVSISEAQLILNFVNRNKLDNILEKIVGYFKLITHK